MLNGIKTISVEHELLRTIDWNQFTNNRGHKMYCGNYFHKNLHSTTGVSIHCSIGFELNSKILNFDILCHVFIIIYVD